ncbi:MAG: hypothetical protein ACYTBJ_26120, partial [Planctomycetota bacterium]
MNLYETPAWNEADPETRETMERDQSLRDIEANEAINDRYTFASDEDKEALISQVTAYRRNLHAPAAEEESVPVEEPPKEEPADVVTDDPETPRRPVDEPEERVDTVFQGAERTPEQEEAWGLIMRDKPSDSLGFTKGEV